MFREALDAGCDDYLAKPYDRTKLVELMKAHVREAEHDRVDGEDNEDKASPAQAATVD